MGTDHEAGEEIINFPVPKRYLSVVIKALAKAMGEVDVYPAVQREEGSTVTQAQLSGAATIDWTSVESCKNLRERIRYPGVLAMLNLTAARPSEFISFQEVVRESERNEIQVRAELGALTKVIRRIYDVTRDGAKWPVEVRWAAGGEEQMYYSMQPEVARAWIQSGK
jgi:hypothetical protein